MLKYAEMGGVEGDKWGECQDETLEEGHCVKYTEYNETTQVTEVRFEQG